MFQKQKLNMKSSTEAELLGSDDTMNQDDSITPRIYGGTKKLYKNNRSTILIQENGKNSSSKRRRHFNIRYVFLTDQV